MPIDRSLAKECYTPLYYAPEIIEAKKYKRLYTFACDIWSVAIIMYILCFYHVPFQDPQHRPNSSEMRKKIRNGEYSIDDTALVSADLRNLLSKMLITDPVKRIDVREILKEKCFRLSNESTLTCSIC